MKNRQFVNNNTAILFLFVIGSFLFIELNFRYWYRFLEQYMMFQTTGGYFQDRLAEPGGLNEYVTEFLSLAFIHPCGASVVIALLVGLISGCFFLYLQACGVRASMLAAILPSFLIWIYPQESIALLVMLAFVQVLAYLYTSIKIDWLRYLFGFLFVGGSYFFAAPANVLLALLIAIYECCAKEDKTRLGVAMIAIAWGGLLPLIAMRTVYILPMREAFFSKHLCHPEYPIPSVNDIKQFFHSVKEKKMEVFDLESDVVVYDVKNKEILSKASLLTKDAFETFPAFSPDGKWLYFCTAPVQKMPENYDKVRYNLCRVAFDPDRGEISHPIDTLVRADSLSYTFPRISPDGRFLMYTETAYGQFPIWHPDAEIRMMDLENRTAVDMSALNSPDTDSYHSWSSNSDWVVFSSRRDNGLYTLPYICYIGKDGKPSKPFLLPQEDPDKYDYQLYSYNIPELTKGAVEVSPYEIQQVAEKNKPEQVRFK